MYPGIKENVTAQCKRMWLQKKCNLHKMKIQNVTN